MQLEGILKILRIEAHVQTVIQPEDYETLSEVCFLANLCTCAVL